MRVRVLLLAVIALLIAGVSWWRIEWQKTHRQRPPVALPQDLRPADPFKFVLYDQTTRLTKLEAYLGRTRLLLLFTGAETDLAKVALLNTLADIQPTLAAAGIQPMVITAAPPSIIRDAQKRRGKPYPFPVLSDIDAQQPRPFPVHHLWGRIDSSGEGPIPGLFLIDRAGRVATNLGIPQPVDDPNATLRLLAAGEAPTR
jgi:peroxiredoxin